MATTTNTQTVSDTVLTHWREQGYLLLRQAIPRDEAAAFLAAADAAIASYEAAHSPERLLYHHPGDRAYRGTGRR